MVWFSNLRKIRHRYRRLSQTNEVISMRMTNVLAFATIPLLLLSFAPSAVNGQQYHTELQYVEAVYSHSGTFTVTKTAPAGIFTETITVDHHANNASVLEIVVFTTIGGSSETLSQNFTITNKSAGGSPDYVVHVPSANFVAELTLAQSYSVINDPPLQVSFYVNPRSGGYGSTSASPWSACGATWSLSASSPPLEADWSRPYSFWDLCIDYNFFWSGSLAMSDTGGFHYSSYPSYTGEYNSWHYDGGTTATVSMGWSYVEIVTPP